MKKETPIYIEEVLFASYDSEETDIYAALPGALAYERRKDFIFDSDFFGIVARIDFCNSRYGEEPPRGVRRKVEVTLIDTTLSCEVATKTLSVNIEAGSAGKFCYVNFPLQETAFEPGHSYVLMGRDLSTEELLCDEDFRLLDPKTLGQPWKWYDPVAGALREPDKERLYTTVLADSSKAYYVHLVFTLHFEGEEPKELPELELRLHYPDSRITDVHFLKPVCVDPVAEIYVAEYAAVDFHLYSGVYYAEFLSMEYPVAGFVFSTDDKEREGEWTTDHLRPLDEYSPSAATNRYHELVLDAYSGKGMTDEDFDKALDDFIAGEHFSFDDDEEEDTADSGSSYDGDGRRRRIPGGMKNAREGEEKPLLGSLDHLTGLRSVKDKLAVYERVVRFNKMRADKDLPVSMLPLHAMFLGSPGTGKTTVAKMMGVMLHRAGLLSRGHVVVRERANLLGQNYNSEAEKTLEAIKEAKGGILLIDEAYQLYQPNDARDPGKFVIETLLTALADESNRDWMLVLAGYRDEMLRMFEMNPGFKSRIPDSNIYYFEDFSEPELMEIAEKYLSRNRYTLAGDAREALAGRISSDYSHREKNFGNARHIINLLQTEVLPAMAVRVTDIPGAVDESSLTEILASDIPQPRIPAAPTRPRLGFSI